MTNLGRAAIGACLVTGMTATAMAEGEATPTIGGGVVAAREPDALALVGVEVEAALWWGRIGIAAEGSRRWDFEGGEPLSTTLGGSARLLVFDRMVSSLFEPRDIEVAFELHGIVEHAWWDHADAANSYGAGLCLRLRGGSDAEFSTMIAESRLFVRVLTSRSATADVAARASEPMTRQRDLSVVIGIGAAWGGGERKYVDRFRLHPLDTLVAGN